MISNERNTLSALRARRELHGATTEANAARLARLIRGPDAGMVRARHLAARLPSLVRAEAQEARAAAMDIDPRKPATEKEWGRLMQKAETLEGWARQCEFNSVQDDALALLERAFAATP